MKKLLSISAVVLMFIATSCNTRKQTCPAYSKKANAIAVKA
jgi:hypothetical protein